MIIISICSYRDDLIETTLKSIIENSNNPSNIFIAVYIQDTYLNILKFKNKIRKSNVMIHYTHYKNAKGPLYARQYIIKNMIKKKYRYYLQVDSHSIFYKNWDKSLIDNYESIYGNKKIITYYPLHFDSDDTYIPVLKDKIRYKNIHKYKPILIKENSINSYYKSDYIGAGFMFTELINIINYFPFIQIPYLFQGEEILLTKTFEKEGFAFLPPRTNIIQHKYKRYNDFKIWNDIYDWEKKNNEALLTLKKLI